MEKFRFDHTTGTVYEYDPDLYCYLFCGRLNGRTEQEFIRDYEQCILEDMEGSN